MKRPNLVKLMSVESNRFGDQIINLDIKIDIDGKYETYTDCMNYFIYTLYSNGLSTIRYYKNKSEYEGMLNHLKRGIWYTEFRHGAL